MSAPPATSDGVFSSTVIPTVGRDTLSRAVTSVLAQSFDGAFEIIVVNDSGTRLGAADWQSSDRVRIVETLRRERSVARNTGAALARGRYLHFLDDDDWVTPTALDALAAVARTTGAGWVYGQSVLVDRNNTPIIQLRHTLSGNCLVQAMAGEWLPLQASLVSANVFFDVGGFNPLISGPEDVDLLRRFCLAGTLAGTAEVVAFIEWRTEITTTDYEGHPVQSRWAREHILDAPRVLHRMRESAVSPYWHGRILRAYLTSMIWNLRAGRLMTATSRAGFGLASTIRAGYRALSPAYWQAVIRAHEGEAFEQGTRVRSVSAPPDNPGTHPQPGVGLSAPAGVRWYGIPRTPRRRPGESLCQ